MPSAPRSHLNNHRDITNPHRDITNPHRDITQALTGTRRAVGYIRVSTDMQATDGLSLDAQTAAIEHYCSAHGLKLVRLCKDVLSGARADRPGLREALDTLHRSAEVLIVLKFDRVSRSIKHFCELYELHFKSGEKELVAIRESIRLDSSLGRALVSILMVFAQMEREATAERTREAVFHIRQCGYHYGKIPYGYKAVPAPDNPRFRVLVENTEEQAVMARIRAWIQQGVGMPAIAAGLTQEEIRPPQGQRWGSSFLYLLAERHGWRQPRVHNERWHSDEDLKTRLVELRSHGHTYFQIASILNEQKWIPLKGRRFTAANVGRLLRRCDETKYQSPKQYLAGLLTKMEHEHAKMNPPEPFHRPSLPRLAALLTEAGYRTPKGHAHWWPAQVQQILEGRFDSYYSQQ